MTPQDVGNLLREARERKKLSLEQLAHETKITLRHLQALEHGDERHLPEPVYVKSFLRKLAQRLDLPAQDLVGGWFVVEPASAPLPPLPPPKPKTGWVWLVAVILSLGALVLTVWRPGKETRPAASPTAMATLTPVATPAVSPVPGSRVQAGVNVKQRSWIRVRVDGRPEFEGFLLAGDRRVWHGEREVTIRVGNSDEVEFVYNGKNLGLAGTGVVERVFTPEGGN